MFACGDKLGDCLRGGRFPVTPAVDLDVATILVFDLPLVVEAGRVGQVNVQPNLHLKEEVEIKNI